MMRTYRGIVCDNKNKYTVFLTKKGDFLRGIPLGGTPDIGDEVDFHVLPNSLLRTRGRKPFFVGPAIVAAVLLVFLFTSFMPASGKALAYVQLETDAALEFGVNQRGKVVSFRQLNDTHAITEFEWKGHSLDTVLDEAVKLLPTGNEEVIIVTVIPDHRKQQKMRVLVEEAVQGVRAEHHELVWSIAESTADERGMANDQQMSVHKFKESKTQPRKKSNRSNQHDEQPVKNLDKKESLEKSEIQPSSSVAPIPKKIENEKREGTKGIPPPFREHPGKASKTVPGKNAENAPGKSDTPENRTVTKGQPNSHQTNKEKSRKGNPNSSHRQGDIKPGQEKYPAKGNGQGNKDSDR